MCEFACALRKRSVRVRDGGRGASDAADFCAQLDRRLRARERSVRRMSRARFLSPFLSLGGRMTYMCVRRSQDAARELERGRERIPFPHWRVVSQAREAARDVHGARGHTARLLARANAQCHSRKQQAPSSEPLSQRSPRDPSILRVAATLRARPKKSRGESLLLKRERERASN